MDHASAVLGGIAIVKAEKRARQVDFIFLNEDTKKDKWFNFDVDYNKVLFLNGLPKQK